MAKKTYLMDTMTEAQAVTTVLDFVKARAAVNTAPPAGYEANCPKCGKASHKSLIDHFGQCMACQNAQWGF